MKTETDRLNTFLYVDYNYPCKYEELTITCPPVLFGDPFDEHPIAEDYISVDGKFFVRMVRSDYERLCEGRFAENCSVTAYKVYMAALDRCVNERRDRGTESTEKGI